MKPIDTGRLTAKLIPFGEDMLADFGHIGLGPVPEPLWAPRPVLTHYGEVLEPAARDGARAA